RIWDRGSRRRTPVRRLRRGEGGSERPVCHPARRLRRNWRPGRVDYTGCASGWIRRMAGAGHWTGSSEHLLGDGNQVKFVGAGRAALATLLDEVDIGVAAAVVDEGAEALELLRVLQRVGPFAFVAIDDLLHLRFQFGRQAQAVVEDHGLEVVESAFEGLAPDRGALQLVGGADVEH